MFNELNVGRDNSMNRYFRIISMLLFIYTAWEKGKEICTFMILVLFGINDMLSFYEYFIVKYKFCNLDNEYL